MKIRAWFKDKYEWLKTFNKQPECKVFVPMCFGIDEQYALKVENSSRCKVSVISSHVVHESSERIEELTDKAIADTFRNYIKDLKHLAIVGDKFKKVFREEKDIKPYIEEANKLANSCGFHGYYWTEGYNIDYKKVEEISFDETGHPTMYLKNEHQIWKNE